MRLSGKLDNQNGSRLRDYISKGYQRLLSKSNTPSNDADWLAYTSLKESSGKFTLFAFDDQGRNIYNQGDSIWNSAFMAQLLDAGKFYVPINGLYIFKLLDYIKSKQAADGSFHDRVNVPYYCSHTTASKVPLTAFIISTFLKYDSAEIFRVTIDKGISFLINQVTNMSEYFDLAITAYAMSVELKSFKDTGHKQAILDQIVARLIDESDEFDNKMFWKINRDTKSSSKIEAVQIETASYMLLTMMNSKNLNYMESILKINKWLNSINAKNSISEHHLSHDTGEIESFILSYLFFYINVNLNLNLKLTMNQNRFYNQQCYHSKPWEKSRRCWLE